VDNPEKIIRLGTVKARCGLSRSTIYNRMGAGAFPLPVSLGARSVGWIDSEISEWIAARIDASRSGARAIKSRAEVAKCAPIGGIEKARRAQPSSPPQTCEEQGTHSTLSGQS